jgi:putative FmdB family regulatory protein
VPFYEYQCDECGNVHEVFQKMADAPLETCPKCGGKLRKLLHPVAIHFKGSGFYATDHRKLEYKKGAEGYDVLEREKYKRAEQGDFVAQKAVEAESKSSSSSSKTESKPK